MPDAFAVVEYGPCVVPSGHASAVSVTVAPGLAVPTMLAFVTPTVGLLGESDPVRVAVGALTVTLTGDGTARVTDPLAPCSVMLLYVAAVVPIEVWIVKVACADPPDGTVTCVGDHDAVDPGICDQFRAAGTTAPANPEPLLNVTVKLAAWPRFTVWLVAFAETLKSPTPLYVIGVVAPVIESRSVPE